MDNTRRPPDLTPSICEEVLENFSKSDDSLAGLVDECHIEVRDFMVLSFVSDQHELAVEQLMRALGLARETVIGCIERLHAVGLVYYKQVGETLEESDLVVSTPAGRAITQRVLAER